MIYRILNKKKDTQIELWIGIRHEIPLCCIMFYESVWRPTIKKKIVDYSKTMSSLTNNQGIILCPDCVTKLLQIKTNSNKKQIQAYENMILN